MNKKHLLAVLAYMLPTFPLGYFWHLTIFAGYYKSLHVYREDIIIPFGILAMLVQGNIWAVVYRSLFSGEPIMRGALSAYMAVSKRLCPPLVRLERC